MILGLSTLIWKRPYWQWKLRWKRPLCVWRTSEEVSQSLNITGYKLTAMSWSYNIYWHPQTEEMVWTYDDFPMAC